MNVLPDAFVIYQLAAGQTQDLKRLQTLGDPTGQGLSESVINQWVIHSFSYSFIQSVSQSVSHQPVGQSVSQLARQSDSQSVSVFPGQNKGTIFHITKWQGHWFEISVQPTHAGGTYGHFSKDTIYFYEVISHLCKHHAYGERSFIFTVFSFITMNL